MNLISEEVLVKLEAQCPCADEDGDYYEVGAIDLKQLIHSARVAQIAMKVIDDHIILHKPNCDYPKLRIKCTCGLYDNMKKISTILCLPEITGSASSDLTAIDSAISKQKE